jgi:hypothetical protein
VNPEQQEHHHSAFVEGVIHGASEYLHKLQDIGHMGKVKLEAFIGHVKSAPRYLIDNEYIQRGYRINFNSHGEIWKSLFMLHNESVNVWSHIIGVGIFIILLFWTIFSLNPFSSYLNFSLSEQKQPPPGPNTFLEFEAYCAKMFNISLTAYAEDAIEVTNEEAFQLWSKAWQ